MLSAFTARPLLELRQRDKSKIESVLLQGDRLYAGLSSGALRIYRVNESVPSQQQQQQQQQQQSEQSDTAQSTPARPTSSGGKPADLLRELEKFSRYSVTQLGLIKEANILISLSNSQVSFHDLSKYELQDTLAKARGATSFAVTSQIVKDESTQIPEIVSYLAVAVKKKLLVWEWRESTISSEERDFTLPATIRTAVWVTGTKIVIGTTTHYVLLDVSSSKMTDISGPGAIGGPSSQEPSRFSGVGVTSLMGGMGPSPLSTRLTEGQVLLSKDINTHFIDTEGKSIGRRQIPWPQAPDAVAYSYPYLLALTTSRGTLEVRNPETLTSLQTINLTGAKMIYVPNPGVSLAHAGKGFVVAGERSVWRMSGMDYDSQVDALVDASRWDEALSLLGMLEDALLEDKEGRTEEVKISKAEHLFKSKKYRQSLDLFTDVKAAPGRVIRLYPATIAGDDAVHDASPTSEPEDNEKEDVKSANGDNKSINTKEETASIVGSIRGSLRAAQKKVTPSKEDKVEDKDLKNAVLELCSFLVETRTRIQWVLDFDGNLKEARTYDQLSEENKAMVRRLEDHDDEVHDEEEDAETRLAHLRATAKLVDSTLFRCYMLAKPQMAGPLFRLPNFIDAEVAEEKLLESKRFSDLVDFFFGKGLHERALELLTNLGKGELKDREVPESLRGPQRIVSYLQNLSRDSIDLILRYVDWPMHTDPDLAMEVFTGDGSNSEHLPRKQVLEYLQSISSVRAAEYLEFIIEEFDEKQADIHHRLIEIYLQSLASNDIDEAGKREQRQKLLSFVRSSRSYEPWRIVPQLRKDDPNLYEARAVVLGRMGQHKQALEIYVFDMENIDKAEEYCNEVWLEQQHPERPARSPSVSRPTSRHAATPTSPGSGSGSGTNTYDGSNDKPTPYLTLLSLLLSPRSPRKAQLAPALDLLARHGARLPAASTLSLIPEHISLADVEAYFRARMRASNSTAAMARIAAGLRKTVDDDAEAALRLGDESAEGGVKGAGRARNRSVLVYEERICKVCRKRFGGSAIKVLPGGEEVVHYGCAAS